MPTQTHHPQSTKTLQSLYALFPLWLRAHQSFIIVVLNIYSMSLCPFHSPTLGARFSVTHISNYTYTICLPKVFTNLFTQCAPIRSSGRRTSPSQTDNNALVLCVSHVAPLFAHRILLFESRVERLGNTLSVCRCTPCVRAPLVEMFM